jgi:hypothetical protein
LLARSTLEYSNKLLHEYSSKETTNYKDINVDLDKYTRAFDVIDVLYQSLRTGMNTYSTYENVKERISDYKKLLNDFNEQVVKRKHIEAIDTAIVTINLRAISNIAKEGDYLYKSVSDLVLYATGAAACSTADLMVVLESINTSLDNIERTLNSAYFETWRFVQLRIGYWKEQVYRTKTKQQMIDDAFGRWRKASRLGR